MSDARDEQGRQGRPRITIVNQRPGCVEVPWVRFLLGDWAGEVIDDPARTCVRPFSIVICDRLSALTAETLARVRETGTVGLFHISQEWYQDPLDAYRAFGFVWRNHYHSFLRDKPVRQLPLAPAAIEDVTLDPSPAAVRPPTERRYSWCFAGQVITTRSAMLAALRRVEGGFEHVTRVLEDRRAASLDRHAYLQMLADSVFVPCAMGQANLESFRVYEALEMGAIPVVERRPWLDYYRRLLGDHPLPTVTSWSAAPELLTRLLADEERLADLHERTVGWWTATKRDLVRAAQEDVEACFFPPPGARDGRRAGLGDLPSVRLGRIEMLRHHNRVALQQRAKLTALRLRRHGSVRKDVPDQARWPGG